MSFLTSLGIRRSGLLLLLAIVIPFLYLKSAFIQGVLLGGFLLSWLMGKERLRWGKFVVPVSSLAAGMVCYYQYGTFRGLEPAITLLSLIAVTQSFDLKNLKDFTVFILICQLLLLAQLLDEYSLWYAVYIFIISLYLFFLMARFHKISDSVQEQSSAPRRKLIRRIFYFSIPLTLVLFFLFPRLPLANLFAFQQRPSGVTGFSNELNPGEISKIAQDSSTYFRVLMKEDALPLSSLYWRGAVLGENQNFKWVKGSFLLKSDRTYLSEEKFEYQVIHSTLESSPFFQLKGTKRVKADSPGHKVKSSSGVQIFHPFGNHKSKYTGEYSGIKREWVFKADREKYLQVSKGLSKSVIDLAESLKGVDANETYQKIATFFAQESFSYTLSPGIQNLEEFLIRSKKGFCEHFASSAAVLLRLNEIPARVVTGFHGGIYNPLGGYFQVRGQDAHAWLEYWDGQRWRRGDPTEYVAPERITYGSDGFLLREELPEGMDLRDFVGLRNKAALTRMLMIWDSLYTRLNQSFLDYDYSAQRKLFNLSGLRKYSGAILMGGCLLILAIATFFWRRKLKTPERPLDKAYKRFLRKLEKVGVQRKVGEGALSLERRIPMTWSSYEDSVELFKLYRDVKYRNLEHKLDQFLTKEEHFKPAQRADKEV